MSQRQLALCPAAGESFIRGWPGLPPSSTRSEACVMGKVAVRLGKGLRASWLRVELRKLEYVPGMEPWGELIGSGPLTLWRAADAASRAHSNNPTDEGAPADGPQEEPWQVLTNQDFPFRLPIPQALPPSARIDKTAGVGYELVASLCVRAMRGMFRKKEASVASIVQTTHPLVLVKHELLPVWQPFLHRVQRSLSADTDQGRIRLILHHGRSAFGPGDIIVAQLTIDSEARQEVKLKRLVFSLRESVSFKTPHRAQRRSRASLDLSGRRSSIGAGRITTVASRTIDPGKKLQPSETRTCDMALTIPRTHALVSITTAKHVEVTYTLHLSLQVNKRNIVFDHLPVKICHCSAPEAEALLPRIGHVEGLSPDPVHSQSTPVLPFLRRAGSVNDSLVSGTARNEESVTMSAIARNPLRRSNSMTSVSTAMASSMNRPNVAGRGIAGAWQSRAGGDAFAHWGGGRFSLPPTSLLAPPAGGRISLPSSAPMPSHGPVRAAMVSEAMPMGLNGAERLALTSRIDREPVEGIPPQYISPQGGPIVRVHPPPAEGTAAEEAGTTRSLNTNSQPESLPEAAGTPADQESARKRDSMQDGHVDQIPQSAHPVSHVPFPEKGRAEAIVPGLIVSPSLTSNELSSSSIYSNESPLPPERRWSGGVTGASGPSFGWGAPLDRRSTLPLNLQVPRLEEQQEEELAQSVASFSTASPSLQPQDDWVDRFRSRSHESAPVPAHDGTEVPPAEKLPGRLSAHAYGQAGPGSGSGAHGSSSGGSTERGEQRPLLSASSSQHVTPTPSTGSEADDARAALGTAQTAFLDDRPPALRPGSATEAEIERQRHQALAQMQLEVPVEKRTMRPLHLPPVRTLPPSQGNSRRPSYDVHAAGAYGTRGALVVDPTTPQAQYDPVTASSSWGNIRAPTAGQPPSAPDSAAHPLPIPPKVPQA